MKLIDEKAVWQLYGQVIKIKMEVEKFEESITKLLAGKKATKREES